MKSILVIDDDRIMRRSLTEALRLIGGYQVSEARDGVEGLEKAKADPPDLIICDVGMPGMDGYGVVEALQRSDATARIPFIFLTGYSDRGSMRQGMVLGADDYISKPFKINELLEAVDARLAKRDLIEGHYEQKLELLRDNILLAVPHELRTPLSLIIGYGEILGEQVESLPAEKIRSLASTITKSGRRLHHLIENYIIFAQIELIMADPVRVNNIRAIREARPDYVVDLVVKQIEKGHGRFATLDLQSPNVILPISNDNLEKIVSELVDNAFKFSPQDTAVAVTTTIDDTGFTLSVCNEGRGMTPEQINNIGVYMQFGRKVHEQQGSGMGLMIAKRLTDLHGGKLTVDSRPGDTTIVRVTLPV